MTTDRYLPIDEDGYVWFEGQRLDDREYGAELFRNLRVGERGRIVTSLRGQDALVEAFDAPLVAKHVAKVDGTSGRLDLPYGDAVDFTFDSLSIDEWDRFHGVTTAGIPFVLSRTAQFEFFDLLDGFDDDSITVEGRTLTVPPWLAPDKKPDGERFWSEHYRNDALGWDLSTEAPALAHILPQLKLSRSRILVLGAGLGHDAAYLARQGHAVTAVDFSPEAVSRARALYAGIEGLEYVQADVFALPPKFEARFDMVFEHTCYCAINPSRRNDLVKTWRRALQPNGHLLGIFFVNEKRPGPPFGGSEWEIRQRLKPGFHSVFWTRWHHSAESRKGLELVVYARKI